MRAASLLVMRLALAGWVGASFLFVTTAIAPMRTPLFDSTQKTQLTQLLFPDYYRLGSLCLATALVAGHFAQHHPGVSRGRVQAAGLLTLAGLVLLGADWLWIYGTLDRMMDAELLGSPRPAAFLGYHRASIGINAVGWLLSLGAASTVNWTPVPTRA